MKRVSFLNLVRTVYFGAGLFVAAPITSLAGLQYIVIALPYANYNAEVLDSLLSLPTHMWAMANKDKLSTERHVRVQLMPQVRMQHRNF